MELERVVEELREANKSLNSIISELGVLAVSHEHTTGQLKDFMQRYREDHEKINIKVAKLEDGLAKRIKTSTLVILVTVLAALSTIVKESWEFIKHLSQP